ncbi:phage major tropism determinant, partial [Guyparkeria halopsychrophila]|uniref:phage major tropism determinant n=1 Tax=Guyparkeria halopsychrophila TaxID=3139421 RepID=UPI0037CB1ADB
SANSAQNAANSETAALAYLEELRGRWFGALSSDPTVDPNGDPVEQGDAYWNTVDKQIRVYNGTSWEGAFSAADVVSHSSATDGLADTPTVQAAIERLAFVARHYDAGGLHEATGQTTIQTPEEVQLRIGTTAYVLTTQTALDVDVAANWDDGTLATPANRAGSDFYLYYCQPASGSEPDLILSANSTMPSSIPSGATPTADNTRKIAGFHCLCADVGTITGHPLSGFLAGDVLPRSVWDQFHRPESEPEGMVYDPSTARWVDIYLASWNGATMESVYNATIADGGSSPAFHWYNFAELLPDGKNLPFQPQFQKMALGSPQETNIAGSADPVTTGGHSDTAGRRIVSNIGCEDCTGVVWQWGAEGGATNDVGSAYAVADTTATAGSYDAINGVGRGQHYEAPNRPVFGGSWAGGSACGSRGSGWNASPLALSSSHSARGVAEPAKNRRI